MISSDEVRRLLLDDVTDQSQNARVFAAVRDLLRTRLELARPLTYIDATNLAPRERKPYFDTAAPYSARMEAVFFDTPAAECLRRNAARHRVVPEKIIHDMALRLVPPTRAEGFSKITVIS